MACLSSLGTPSTNGGRLLAAVRHSVDGHCGTLGSVNNTGENGGSSAMRLSRPSTRSWWRRRWRWGLLAAVGGCHHYYTSTRRRHTEGGQELQLCGSSPPSGGAGAGREELLTELLAAATVGSTPPPHSDSYSTLIISVYSWDLALDGCYVINVCICCQLYYSTILWVYYLNMVCR